MSAAAFGFAVIVAVAGAGLATTRVIAGTGGIIATGAIGGKHLLEQTALTLAAG